MQTGAPLQVQPGIDLGKLVKESLMNFAEKEIAQNNAAALM